MSTEHLIQKENNNDGSQMYLYYNPMLDTWAAYGYSAYALRLYVKSHGYDNLKGFSSELQMPCMVTSNEVIKIMRHEMTIAEEKHDEYIHLAMPKKIDMKEYLRWLDKLQKENKNQEGLIIKTRVSQYVPKGVFIPDQMSAFSRNTKRIVDCMAALGALIFFSPLILLCYILVKKEDGGPAIFKQERIGRFGRPFHIYKFRSMRLDAEKFGPQLSHSGGDDDPRLTKIGHFLRAHHLDELPQLWNVFVGDMAFIGPRPERKFFIDQILEYDKRYVYLYQIRPGVTSYATLYNGYTDTMQKMLQRLEYDLYYLGHRSFWFDFKVLFNTFRSIVFGKKF